MKDKANCLSYKNKRRKTVGETSNRLFCFSKYTYCVDLADIDIRDREDKYTLAIIKKLDFLGIEDKCKVEGYIDRILDENGVDKLIIK